ncbi:MAG TPA: fatty acid desaturase [Thermoanaerobaculia bacterium]|nr:fatty acid desaturase [Thermoanaerobaculia bacterium]
METNLKPRTAHRPASPASGPHESTPRTSATPDARTWNEILKPYKRAHDGKALWQLATTAALFAGVWWAMLASLQVGWWLTWLLAIPAAGLFTRLFIFQHDCGHGAFFRSQKVNNAVGSVLGVVTLFPYHYWRRTHAIHHATHGDLDRREFGDIVTITVDEYRGRSRWGRLAYRLYRNLFVLLVIGPTYQFVIKHRLPLDAPRDWKREWASVLWTNLGIAAAVTVLATTVGLVPFLMVQAPIIVLGGALGVWLFYVQHQFEDTYWEHNPQWEFHRAAFEGSSFLDLPRVLHWFTGNIGYHHIHHLSSRIPNYELPRCMAENPELQHVTRFGLLESLRCSRLKLWDEESRRLIGFRELARRRSTAAEPPAHAEAA